MIKKICAPLLLISGLSSCYDVEDYFSDDLYAYYKVEFIRSDHNFGMAYAEFHSGKPDGPRDWVSATPWVETDGGSYDMRSTANPIIGSGNRDYDSEIFATPSSKITFTLDLGERLYKASSTVTLPGPFEILSPYIGATFHRHDDIPITWNPGKENEQMEVTIEVNCSSDLVTDFSFKFDDVEGYAIISPADFLPDALINYEGRCFNAITLARIKEGILDKNFAGGSIKASQIRRVYNIETYI